MSRDYCLKRRCKILLSVFRYHPAALLSESVGESSVDGFGVCLSNKIDVLKDTLQAPISFCHA